MSTTLLDWEEYALKIGRQEGHQEGRQAGRQEAILELLELRFERVSEGLAEAVRGIHDDAQLGLLFRTAATCTDIEAFAEKL